MSADRIKEAKDADRYTPEEVKAALLIEANLTLDNKVSDAFYAGKILMWDEMRKQLEEYESQYKNDMKCAALRANQMLEAKDKEIAFIKNELLDALDLKNGTGPTALRLLKDEIESLKASQEQPKEGVDMEQVACEALGYSYEVYKSRLSGREKPYNFNEIQNFVKGYTQALTSHTKQGEGFSLSDEQILQKRYELYNDGKSRSEQEIAIQLVRWAIQSLSKPANPSLSISYNTETRSLTIK